ncbi:hypothetical protein WA158_005927 [Blastocystis sp. Blastoise]
MVKAAPLVRYNIIKKKTNKWVRFQADKFKRMNLSEFLLNYIYFSLLIIYLQSPITDNHIESIIIIIFMLNQHWRKPKGIDCRARRRFRGATPMPRIGYGSNKLTRHMLPNGLRKYVINNVRDLELLMMHNRTYCAEIAHSVSARKRVEIVKRAEELSITVTNAKDIYIFF